jgi:HAD superfamily hydrolase (TIGR01459 family)
MRPAAIPILSSITELSSTCEAWIVDIWGVMHNGVRAYAAASEACRRFRRGGGFVVLLSNAPRPFRAVGRQLAALGVDPESYDGGLTSGDVTRGLLEAWSGRSLLHIGPERDKGLFEGLTARLTTPDAAEAIVCSGLWDDSRETPANYEALFEALAARRLPMLCANPDLMVERGDKLVYCAGALAALYAQKGAEVIFAGKPHVPIYEHTFAALDRLAGRALARERILAIGDGIDTDLLGAHRAGLRSVFIASAVHLPGGLNAQTLDELFASRPFRPIAALPALA